MEDIGALMAVVGALWLGRAYGREKQRIDRTPSVIYRLPCLKVPPAPYQHTEEARLARLGRQTRRFMVRFRVPQRDATPHKEFVHA
jgi:hypothetical protein